MKTIGIVAEYNPFHLGHALQIRESRRRVQSEGEEICVLDAFGAGREKPWN